METSNQYVRKTWTMLKDKMNLFFTNKNKLSCCMKLVAHGSLSQRRIKFEIMVVEVYQNQGPIKKKNKVPNNACGSFSKSRAKQICFL